MASFGQKKLPNYTTDEDQHLCRVYLDISQDSETGIYQKRDNFWNRILEVYNSEKPSPNMCDRNKRSIETRMQVKLSHLSKFKACVQQVEYLNQSGASEKDILKNARRMMAEDAKFPKGFKFEHVWDIMKDFQKFDCSSQNNRRPRSSFESETNPETPMSPETLSSFSINLSDGSGSGSASAERPECVKKAKNKRKVEEDMSGILKSINEGNKKIGDLMDNSSAKKDQIILLQQQKIEAKKQALAFRKWEADNKILMIDTDNISDPIRREYFKQEQARIIIKRQEDSSANDAFNMFQGTFQDFGGSGGDIGGCGSDLGPY